MLDITYLFLTLCISFFLSWLGTALLVRMLPHWKIYDIPNHRTNHIQPTPRGGGMAIVASATIGTIMLLYRCPLPLSLWPAYLGILGIFIISLWDDIRTLPFPPRLCIHILAVIGGISILPDTLYLFQGIFPFWLDRILIGLCWLWFMNLYNFMDGIDGITSMETIMITIPVAFMAWYYDFIPPYVMFPLLLTAASAGFLCWNWHPSRIFMGDGGSMTLGYVIGGGLIYFAMSGFWMAALLLPAYYFADSGITLLKRILQHKRIWEAHSEHFYQQAVRSGLSHSRVVVYITLLNSMLAVMAILNPHYQGLSSLLILGGSALLVLSLLCYFYGRHQRVAPSDVKDQKQ